MDLFSGIIYGFIQGVTEFLPVSSSGHLALMPKVMEISDPGVAFDLWMHVGTALSVLIYFRKNVLALIQEFIIFLKAPKVGNSNPQRIYLFNFILTTATTGILGLFILALQKSMDNAQRAPMVIASNLIIFGIIMWAIDKMAFKKFLTTGQERSTKSMTPKEALLVGIFQAIAVFPGVSRSGITLTITRYLGMSRENAAAYSFLLSLPLIIVGAIMKVGDLPEQINVQLLFVGVLSSFIFGLITIHLFIELIKKIGLGVFCLYRIILAILVIMYLA